jgi:hypothetical protein
MAVQALFSGKIPSFEHTTSGSTNIRKVTKSALQQNAARKLFMM